MRQALQLAEAGDRDNEREQEFDQNLHIRSRPIPAISIHAYCEAPKTADAIKAAAGDRRLAKAHVSIEMGGVQAAVSRYESSPTPNLIIIESIGDRALMLADLARLAEACDPGTKVIVTGQINDVLLYRELLKRGVGEYLVAPVSPLQILESISNLYTDPQSQPIGRLLAFIGAKGGVGSSVVCHNVAWSIAEQLKTNVVIADLDLPFGTAGLDFNQDPAQGIADALASPERLDEMLLDRLLSKCSEHLSIFAAPVTLDREHEISADACGAVFDVVRRNFPFAAVDLPHTWTDWSRRILLSADEVVITAAPDLANLRNVKNLADLLKQSRSNDGPPLLVLNTVGLPKRPEISVKEFCQNVGLKAAAVIEYDGDAFGQAGNNGQMIEEVNRKAKAAEHFRSLAMQLTHHKELATQLRKAPFAPLLEKLRLTR